jgi:hypothetical protein
MVLNRTFPFFGTNECKLTVRECCSDRHVTLMSNFNKIELKKMTWKIGKAEQQRKRKETCEKCQNKSQKTKS